MLALYCFCYKYCSSSSFSFKFFVLLQRCIVLDIEGTTTPISFVTDVLFPYARDNVGRHLSATYDIEETQDDIKLLRSQVRIVFSSAHMLTVHVKYPALLSV